MMHLAGRRSYRAYIVAVTIIACASIAIGMALASIPDSSGVIHGCYQSSGHVRIIDDSVTSCKNNETAISWQAGDTAGPVGQSFFRVPPRPAPWRGR